MARSAWPAEDQGGGQASIILKVSLFTKRPMNQATLLPEDHEAIARQIGRAPHGVMSVAYRCPSGHPGVALTYPLKSQNGHVTPFPSQMWLTCPLLTTHLSELERTGVIADLQQRLVESSDLQARFADDHRRCIAHRWSLLSPEDQDLIQTRNMTHIFAQRGIGGVRHWMTIKCLHLHFAHHLTLGDTVGQLLEKEYGVEPCREKQLNCVNTAARQQSPRACQFRA
ncbi:MAG: hypothetical protein CMJ20_04720 [Phycisphaeraceae bacterium]|nr:hypothetical protein [Phycisphaeraceae bacterium]|tara:strand:- start:769 stop:1446 length:678 start_codon:yes stop_codon:yes gene_type:complete